MATIKAKRGPEANLGSITLADGEFAITKDSHKLYVGVDGSKVLLIDPSTTGDMTKGVYDTDNDGVVDWAEKVDWSGIQNKPNLRLAQQKYVTTTAAAEGYYRVATIPINAPFKNASFKVKGYTATGTVTESTIDINLAYYSGNYGSQSSAITANTSHSFTSGTNAENGYVLLYCRVSFDGTNAYIDLYKYKATAVTIEIEPLIESDWVWATGALTVNPTVGAYRNTTATLYYGLSGNNITANGSNSATYANYGVLGTETIHDTLNKTGQWEYIGNIYFGYNSSYLEGHSFNTTIRLQELSFDGSKNPSNLDDFDLHIRGSLATHADANAFNSLIPTIYAEVTGKYSINPETDIALLVHSTSTSNKYVRVYIKLKEANAVYAISPRERYGRSFNATTAMTTSYCYFSYAGQQPAIAALPTPAQGAVVYATKRLVDADTLNGYRASDLLGSGGGSGGPKITTSTTEPSSPSAGDFWYKKM